MLKSRSYSVLLFGACVAMFGREVATAQAPSAGPPRAEPTIHLAIGALLPLTGGPAEQGLYAQRGIQFAVEDIQKAKRVGIEVLYEDTHGDPKTALDAYRAVLAKQKISAIATWGSGVGMVLSPVVNHDKIIQIGVATGTPDYRSPRDFTFRTFHSTLDEADFAAATISTGLAGRPVAILQIDNEYGASYAKALQERIEKGRGVVTSVETFPPGTADFRAMLTRVKRANPAVVFVAAYPAEGAALLRQRRELGLVQPVLAAGAIVGGADFVTLMRSAGEGVSIIAPAPGDSPAARRFQDRYRAKFGDDLGGYNWYAADAFDAVKMLSAAAEQCGHDQPTCLRDRLLAMTDYDGAAGPVRFDEYGDVKSRFTLLGIAGGKLQKVQSSHVIRTKSSIDEDVQELHPRRR